MKAITYPKSAYLEITDAEYTLIRALNTLEKKGHAIRFIKEQYSLGLIEAKTIVDTIGAIQT